MELTIAIILFIILISLIYVIKTKILGPNKRDKPHRTTYKSKNEHVHFEDQEGEDMDEELEDNNDKNIKGSKDDINQGDSGEVYPNLNENSNIEWEDIDENDPEYKAFEENMKQKFGSKNLEKKFDGMHGTGGVKNRALKLKPPKV